MKAGPATVVHPPDSGRVEAPQEMTSDDAPPEADDERAFNLDPEFLAWLEELL